MWPAIAALADDEVPPPRVICGGAGCSFTMTPPKPDDPKYLRPMRGPKPNVVRALVDEDFFPERELHFTAKTGELPKIEGKRRARGQVAPKLDECGRHWQLVVAALRGKYPTLALITEPAPSVRRTRLCEGSRRLPGDSRLIGTGRCIRLECTPTIEDRAMLATSAAVPPRHMPGEKPTKCLAVCRGTRARRGRNRARHAPSRRPGHCAQAGAARSAREAGLRSSRSGPRVRRAGTDVARAGVFQTA